MPRLATKRIGQRRPKKKKKETQLEPPDGALKVSDDAGHLLEPVPEHGATGDDSSEDGTEEVLTPLELARKQAAGVIAQLIFRFHLPCLHITAGRPPQLSLLSINHPSLHVRPRSWLLSTV